MTAQKVFAAIGMVVVATVALYLLLWFLVEAVGRPSTNHRGRYPGDAAYTWRCHVEYPVRLFPWTTVEGVVDDATLCGAKP